MAISFVVLVTLVSCGNEAKKMSAKVWLLVIYIICYPLVNCLVAPCHLRCHSWLPSHPCCLVIALSPSHCCCLAVASPLPCPPFCPPSSSSRPPLLPHKDGNGNSDRHRHHRSLSPPVLLPPPLPFFLPPFFCFHCLCPNVSVTLDALAVRHSRHHLWRTRRPYN